MQVYKHKIVFPKASMHHQHQTHKNAKKHQSTKHICTKYILPPKKIYKIIYR